MLDFDFMDDNDNDDAFDAISKLVDEAITNDNEDKLYQEIHENTTRDNSNQMLNELLELSDDDFDDDDDDDEDDDDEDDLDDEVLATKGPSKLQNEDQLDPETIEALKKAQEVLNPKQQVFQTKEEEEIYTFGKHEIVYNKSNVPQEKYAKLVEDEKINETQYPEVHTTVERIKSSIDKYPEEREEIQKFLTFNDKEQKVSEVRGLIEAAIFVFGQDGLNAYDIKKITKLPLAIINNILEEMVWYYNKNKNSGLSLKQYGNVYKFVTKEKFYNDLANILNRKEKTVMSDAVLETLAIIAYNQPCTKGTIEKIRGKSCDSAIEKLKRNNLIEADERSEAIGKPWLYSVTNKFFDLFGIKSLSELPAMNRNDKTYTDEIDENANYTDEINEEN